MAETSERKQPCIICSVANAPLYGQFASSFRKFGEGITPAYDGISALPFRAKDIVRLYQEYFPPVVLVENAWNPGTYDNVGLAMLNGVYGNLRRFLGDTSEPPILQDTLLFPGKSTVSHITRELMNANSAAYFGAINFEDTRFPGRTHVHVQSAYQSHDMSVEQILDLSQKTDRMLLFDPTHLPHTTTISTSGNATTEKKGAWERPLEALATRIIGVDIHAKNSEEMEELMRFSGELFNLAVGAHLLCENQEWFRVEALVDPVAQVPISHFQKRGIHFLSEIALVLREITKD